MTAESIEELVRRLSRSFNERRFDEIEATIFSPALVYQHNGREDGLKRWLKDSKGCVASFPDAREVIQSLTVDGDTVSVTFRFQGTHLGPLGPTGPTGREFDVEGTATYRVMDGLIVEARENIDDEALGMQLGLA